MGFAAFSRTAKLRRGGDRGRPHPHLYVS